MRNETREIFNAYMARMGELNGITVSLGQKYSVAPSVQQTLEERIQESSDFLGRINNIGVIEQSGEKIGLGIGSTIASTTNTAVQDRQPADPTNLDKDGYTCTQTNFDTYLTYAKLDAWAKFPDFQTKFRDAVLKRQALDVLCIGFNGASRAATSDRVANPLLQDVNVGWLEKIRQNAAARVLSEVEDGSGEIRVYEGGDYNNLDAVVFDAVRELIDPWFRRDTELVAIIGSALFSDKYFPLVNAVQPPSEKIATDLIISQKRIGGLQAVQVPYFPEDAILITRLDNLSRYYQEGARRRTVVDNAKRDRIENYESSNDAYVVEDYGCAALIENIKTAA